MNDSRWEELKARFQSARSSEDDFDPARVKDKQGKRVKEKQAKDKARWKAPKTPTQKKERASLVAWLQDQKRVKCPDCGFDGCGHPEAMEFDHLPGFTKKFTISKFARDMAGTENVRAILEAEIAKCEVCCANCHRIRTKRRDTQARKKRSG
jgi:hypothetical protein